MRTDKKWMKAIRAKLSADIVRSVEEARAPIASLEKEIIRIGNELDNANRRIEQLMKQAASRHAPGTYPIDDTMLIANLFTGLKIYLDPRDISVAPHTALNGVWERNITKAWLNVLRPTDRVLDIGANFGYFGLIAAQRTSMPNGVILFEANPKLIPYIEKSVEVNWLKQRVAIENLAIAEKSGSVKLNIFEDYIGSASIHTAQQIDSYMHGKMHINQAEQVEVRSVSVDEYCKKKGIDSVDLIKIDIEGYEEQACQGMKNVIKSSPELTMFIEFTKGAYKNPKKLYEGLLKDFGHVYTILPDGEIEKPNDNSYETLVDAYDDWVMPIFSKRDDLATTHDR